MTSEARLEIRLIEPELPRFLQRIRPQSARAEFADDGAVLALVEVFELEQILGDDHVAFHPDHLGDPGGAAAAVAQALFKFEYLDETEDGTIIGEFRPSGLRPYTLEKARQFGFDQAYLEACL